MSSSSSSARAFQILLLLSALARVRVSLGTLVFLSKEMGHRMEVTCRYGTPRIQLYEVEELKEGDEGEMHYYYFFTHNFRLLSVYSCWMHWWSEVANGCRSGSFVVYNESIAQFCKVGEQSQQRLCIWHIGEGQVSFSGEQGYHISYPWSELRVPCPNY